MTAKDFAADILSNYGVELPIVHDSLDEARREAQRRGAYLLVYIHSPTHEDTSDFLTKVLTHPKVRDLLETRFVLFGISVLELEGRRLEVEVQATTFPFLAVMVKRSIVLKIKGLLSVEDLLRNFRNTFDRWDRHLVEEVNVRLEREEKERDRREEERRAAEMQAVDRERIRQYEERERQRRERAERDRREREAAALKAAEEMEIRRAEEMEREQRRSQLEGLRAAAAARLPPEPPTDADVAAVVLISFRSLRGTQHNRRFYRTDKLSCLHDFAVSLEDYNGGEFELIAGYPPRPLVVDSEKTFADVPLLLPRAVVLMRGK